MIATTTEPYTEGGHHEKRLFLGECVATTEGRVTGAIANGQATEGDNHRSRERRQDAGYAGGGYLRILRACLLREVCWRGLPVIRQPTWHFHQDLVMLGDNYERARDGEGCPGNADHLIDCQQSFVGFAAMEGDFYRYARIKKDA